ncbi:MAG: septum formation initiator family protein [Gemmatimonadales bacterium]|nr:septum formation initiator family protein [Gemmatimonadales bacterium]
MRRGRVVGAIALLGGLAFGAFGGEYGTFDWFSLRRQIGEQQRAIEQLQVEIDSLAEYAAKLQRDPFTQEKVARERFGMIRPGEILYQIEPIR